MTASNHSPANNQAAVENSVESSAEPSAESSLENSVETSAETNEETLRELTGAPNINQSLVSESAFADIDIRSSRPIWKLPVPKLALIAVALVPVFGLAGYFLQGSQSAPQASVPSPSEKFAEPDANTDADASTDPASTELARANKEIATLKSQMALDDQAYVQDNKKSATPSSASRNQPANPEPQPTARPQAVNVATRSTPPTVSVSSSPPSIQSSTPRFNTPASPVAVPDNFVDIDPFEKWRQLAQLGSYGSSKNGDLAGSTETEIAAASGSNPLLSGSSNTNAVTSAVPAAYFATTSATEPAYAAIDFQEDSLVEPLPEPSESNPPDKSPLVQAPAENLPNTDEPDILSDAESRILDEQILSTTNTMQSLIAGGHVAGELVTPVVLDSEGVEDRFMVVLSEPLTNNASRIAIPAGALLVVRVDRVSENGLVQLSATEAIWEEQGFQRELVLPSQTILIRGDRGNPLITESYGDMGGDIAAMDLGQFALGAIRRVGELYTRSDSRVQTGDGTTVITESNPAPNILAGALEGGSDAILDAISERNQQAIERLRSQPRVPHIPAGSSVQVFINRSMQMPSGF